MHRRNNSQTNVYDLCTRFIATISNSIMFKCIPLIESKAQSTTMHVPKI